MKLKFWGVRGSIACPGPDTVHYGGNTACIEIKFEELDRRIIIDAGSGIRLLGNEISKKTQRKGPFTADIFITHTHWDHIMGFPFFDPIYMPGSKLSIYGPVTYEEDTLEQVVGDQLRYRYFPVLHSDLAAKLNYHQIGETVIDIGDGIVVKSKFLNHTLLCLGYRIEYRGKSICTAFDTEPFRNLFAADPGSPDFDVDLFEEGERVTTEENQKLVDFFHSSDALIHDAQYTEAEYTSSKQGWGHSYFEYAIHCATQANVKKLFFFHHDPYRTDDELRLLDANLHKTKDAVSVPELFMAREGEEIEI
jgi:phosphoribosyl 1,2-cyclic phosphodiesterase